MNGPVPLALDLEQSGVSLSSSDISIGRHYSIGRKIQSVVFTATFANLPTREKSFQNRIQWPWDPLPRMTLNHQVGSHSHYPDRRTPPC